MNEKDKTNADMRELTETETEKVTGGGIHRGLGPRRFITPKRPQQDEKKDGEGGDATGGW